MTNKLELNLEKTWFNNISEKSLSVLDNTKINNWQELVKIGFPTNKNEEWKYFNFSTFFELLTNLEVQNNNNNLSNFNYLKLKECLDYFVLIQNGFFKTKQINSPDLIINTLKNALLNNINLKQKYSQQILLFQKNNAFSLINNTFWEDGLFCFVPENTVLNKPIQINLFCSENNTIVNNKNLIIIEKNSTAEIIINTEGLNSNVYLHNLVNQIIIGENSKVKIYFLQNENQKSIQITHSEITLEKNSSLNFISLCFGAEIHKHYINTKLIGENINCDLKGVYILNQSQKVHNQINLEHLKPNSFSNQLFKGILLNQANAEFTGIIKVNSNANGTNAKQLSRNLLLSEDCVVHTRPQLEINNDDVKCSHGATIGQLQEDEIFYMCSRGISRKQALQILTLSFAEEILDYINILSLKKLCKSLLQNKIK